MSRQHKALIIKFSNISNQPRIYRQILFLKDSFDIDTAAFNSQISPFISNHFNIKIPFLPYGLIDKFLWNIPPISKILLKRCGLLEKDYDLIIAHDPFTLQTSLQLSKKNNTPVLHDAHEYTPLQFEHNLLHRFLNYIWDYICKKYMRCVQATITVNQGIADKYKVNYGTECEIINNAPFFHELKPSPTDPNKIRMVYHGVAHSSRHTENMIYLMNHLDERFHLDLLLLNDGSRYYKRILELGVNNPRISFPEPVPMPELPRVLNKYDIGLYLLMPTSFNTFMALPNKIFEFIQARLAIAVWPSPEIARIANEYSCGLVSDDFTLEPMSKKLNALTADDISKFKTNAALAAQELCAERNREMFLNIVGRLISKD